MADSPLINFKEESVKMTTLAAVFLCLLGGFAGGFLVGRAQAPATIELRNESGAPIERVEIIASSTPLASGQTQAVSHAVRGEGGYALRAVFADGTVRENTDIYVQQGNRQVVRFGKDRSISIQ